MRDKAGNYLTTKEFMARWKSGIMSMTPLQQLQVTVKGNWFILIGILWGCGVTIYNKQWWLVLILIGSLIVSVVSQIGTYQRIKSLKSLDEVLGGEPNVV